MKLDVKIIVKNCVVPVPTHEKKEFFLSEISMYK